MRCEKSEKKNNKKHSYCVTDAQNDTFDAEIEPVPMFVFSIIQLR